MEFENFFNAEISDDDLVTQWLNAIAVSQDNSERLQTFHKIQEFLLRKVPILLPTFLDNVLDLAADRSADIKKALVGFIEEICKQNEDVIPRVMRHLHLLLCDQSIPVQKRVIQAAIAIYKKTLHWLCRAKNITSEMEEAWNELTNIKSEISNLIDSDNDGIRTSAVKFLECVILLQTYPDSNEKKGDFSLENVPLTLKIARRRKLEEEALELFEMLIKFIGSQHISSANLLACLGIMTNIAKNRPDFMDLVVTAISSLHSNLPPTLTTTQVNSVRKKLKTELLNLIKHPAAYDFADVIMPILTDLGCTSQEIAKMLPKPEERKRYAKRTLNLESVQQAKKPRLERDSSDPTTETTEKFIIDNLTTEKAVQLAFLTLKNVPSDLPPTFFKDYAESLKFGPVGQVKTIAKLLAAQLIEAGYGPEGKFVAKKAAPVVENVFDDVVVKVETEEEDKKKERKAASKVKTLKLNEITKPLPKEIKEKLMSGSVVKLLTSDRTGSPLLREKVITTLAATFSKNIRELVLEYLLSDLRTHVNVALAWLYEEYSIMQGFARIPALRREGRLDQSYSTLLTAFVSASSTDAIILSRLLLEAPLITESVLDLVCIICKDEHRCGWALGLLKDLTIRRPPKQMMFLNALLQHTTHNSTVVRDCAVGHVLALYKRTNLKRIIDEFARRYLEYLRYQSPPECLFGSTQGRVDESKTNWSDDLVKASLTLYTSLLTVNEALIHDLAKVYIQTSPDIKRIILRLLENPIRVMGMGSPELLKLVEDCPKGSETLVTRVIHILTDKSPPTADLVQRVRDLYNTRVSDVRFLIPVLNGLSKKEVIAALPKLIKLNPVVVKEVFNRLLGTHGDSPITPTELLVALHLIDPAKVDLKTCIKATSMCLNEKHIFTQEVLAVVLQQLMDQPTIPTLLMRTVIQALGSYPRLSGFVMNILQRLILKQVWKHKVVWEGFVKCCQRTKPQSFTVIMQLPAPQLQEALAMCPELREPLREHLMNFTEAQRAHIPSAVQEVLLGLTNNAPTPIPSQMPPDVPPQGEPLSSEPLPPGME